MLLLGVIFGALAVASGVWARLTTGPGYFIYGRDNWRDVWRNNLRNNTNLRPRI